MLRIIMIIENENFRLLKWLLSTSLGNEVSTLNFIPDKAHGFVTNVTVSGYHNLGVAQKIKTLSVERVTQGYAMEKTMITTNAKNKVHEYEIG